MPDNNEAIYPISVAAKLLDVHSRTIRIYEEVGLLKPTRRGNKRFFSQNDIDWIRCIRDLIHKEGISIPGIQRLLQLIPCWQIKNCPDEVRIQCAAFVNHSLPCWKMAATSCKKEEKNCAACQVYLNAMAACSEEPPTHAS